MLLDGVQIAALVRRLGRDAALPRLAELPALQEVLAQIDIRIFGNQLSGGLDVAHGDVVPLFDEPRQLLDELRDAGGVVRFALDDELVALGPDPDV